MIDSVEIFQVSTYTGEPQSLTNLRPINFIYGANGAGKSTIGRVIGGKETYPACNISWRNNIKMDVFVYNKDFVEKNFNHSRNIKGVFTLGEERVEIKDQIENNNKLLQDLSAKIASCHALLNGDDKSRGKNAELSILEGKAKEAFWLKKQKYDDQFQAAFEGYRGNSELFKDKILSEKNNNKNTVEQLSILESRAKIIFSNDLKAELLLHLVDPKELIDIETDGLFQKKIIGQSDVNIAKMIDKLGNSDWVKEGISFYEKNDSHCPFCQRSMDREFERLLFEYFNEAYKIDVEKLSRMAEAYDLECDRLISSIDSLRSSGSRYLDVDKFDVVIEKFRSRNVQNKQLIETKLSEVSRSITLLSSNELVLEINALIEACNKSIIDHNKMVENIGSERVSLKNCIWAFIVDELSTEISSYLEEKNNLQKTIEGLKASILKHESEKKLLELENQKAEKQITSVKPTVDAINNLLLKFGYQGFKLAQTEDMKSYTLIRSDGTDAKETLSEGEKTFVTFLYFFQLLSGGESESTISSDRIVVFDDPVSSLDSNILFVVGSLIRVLMEGVVSGRSHLKQIFVMTHNIYFHKEVSFNINRKGGLLKNDETFWLVRKPQGVSVLEGCQENPIKTSYELLWRELSRKDLSKLTVQNTIRRILENYFKFFGGIDPKHICNKLPEGDRAIGNSLFSWINDGSHYIVDDLYVSLDDVAIDVYLRVFKDIFFYAGQESHYEMMMQATAPTVA